MGKRAQTQLMELFLQLLLYAGIYASFFAMMAINNPQIVRFSRTAAVTLLTFTAMLGVMTSIYGGFDVGRRKQQTVTSSLVLSTMLTDTVTYLQLQIMNVNNYNKSRLELFGKDFAYLFIVIAIQLVLIIVLVQVGSRLFFRINPPQRCVIVASSQEAADHVAQKLYTFPQRFEIVDVVDYRCQDVCATIFGCDAVFLAALPHTELSQLESFCYKYDKAIYLQAVLEDVVTSTAAPVVLDDTPFLLISHTSPTLFQSIVKRLADIFISVVGIALFSPLMIAAAIAIRATDGKPVFFRQKRATIDGRVFRIVKFRTMREDGARDASATVDDERVTRVGQFLRRYRLDELPQLFNILAGQMSFVGPRPEMLENIERYTKQVPEFIYRQRTKAGLTGMAQIDGKYNTSPQDKLMLDLFYIENFSLFLDAKMILRTLTVFLRRDSTEGFSTQTARKAPKMRSNPRATRLTPERKRKPEPKGGERPNVPA